MTCKIALNMFALPQKKPIWGRLYVSFPNFNLCTCLCSSWTNRKWSWQVFCSLMRFVHRNTGHRNLYCPHRNNFSSWRDAGELVIPCASTQAGTCFPFINAVSFRETSVELPCVLQTVEGIHEHAHPSERKQVLHKSASNLKASYEPVAGMTVNVYSHVIRRCFIFSSSPVEGANAPLCATLCRLLYLSWESVTNLQEFIRYFFSKWWGINRLIYQWLIKKSIN